MSSADSIKQIAAQWLERRIAEDWTADDQAALDHWLEEDTAHRVAYLRLETVWTRTYQFAPLRRQQSRQPKRFRPIFDRLAAGLLVAAAVSGGVAHFSRAPQQKIFTTGLGERETISLADGTKIELNSQSSLRLAANNPRQIWLEQGEAFFQVRHDAQHPFVVRVGDHTVTDLGTKFSIRRETGVTRVAVVEGRVRVTAVGGGDDKSVLLKAGDIGLASKEALRLSQKPVAELEDESAWQKGLLVFHHATLAEAASQYNRYNRDRILIADAQTAKLTINGSLPTNDVDAFVRLAQKFFDLHVERRQGNIILSR